MGAGRPYWSSPGEREPVAAPNNAQNGSVSPFTLKYVPPAEGTWVQQESAHGGTMDRSAQGTKGAHAHTQHGTIVYVRRGSSPPPYSTSELA